MFAAVFLTLRRAFLFGSFGSRVCKLMESFFNSGSSGTQGSRGCGVEASQLRLRRLWLRYLVVASDAVPEPEGATCDWTPQA